MDRMADGELSSDEQRNLLLKCEEEDRWRELALTYVESQVLGGELSQPSFLSGANEASSKEVVAPSQNDSKPSRDWNVMSLAAAVLLSLGLGYGLGWWWQGDSNLSPVQMARDNQTSLAPPIVKNLTLIHI